MTELWRGFANMAATKGREVVIAKGRGSTVWDDKGKSYLDSTASLWYMNVGYGRDEIADAVGAQLKELAAFHTFGPFANPPLLELADKVAELSATGRRRSLLHLRRRLRRRGHGRQARTPLLDAPWAARRSRSSSRASTATTASTASARACRASRSIAPATATSCPHIENVPWGDADALERLLADHGDQVAAFIGEPVIGAGGVIPPPDGFWTRVRGALPAP